MSDKIPQTLSNPSTLTLEDRLQAIFRGYDGFGLILFFWALLGSLISAIALTAISFAYWSWWALFLGLIALRCFAYLGRIGEDLLDKITPYDG